MRYRLVYVWYKNEFIKPLSHQLFYSPIWSVVEKIPERGTKSNPTPYKILKFRGIFNSTQQCTILNTTRHFETLEEAMMYVSMQE